MRCKYLKSRLFLIFTYRYIILGLLILTLIDTFGAYLYYQNVYTSPDEKFNDILIKRILHNKSMLVTEFYDASSLELKRTFKSKSFDAIDETKLSRNKRILVLDTYTVGYGNRLYSLFNSLLLSILTNLTLIVNWNHINDYIYVKHPNVYLNSQNKPVESFLLPGLDSKSCVLNTGTYNSWRKIKNISILHTQIPHIDSSCRVIRVENFNPFWFELSSNHSHATILALKGLIDKNIITSNKSTIEEAYTPGFNFAYTILNYIWFAQPDLTNQINRFIIDNFHHHFVIGIQIRFLYLDVKNDLEQILKCAIMIEKQQHALRKASSNENMSFKWFISGDSGRLVNRLRRSFPDRVINTKGIVANIDYNSLGYKRTVIDSELLSRCDELIITGGSTYGFVSAMRSGRMPLYFNGKRNETRCWRSSFSRTGLRKDYSFI